MNNKYHIDTTTEEDLLFCDKSVEKNNKDSKLKLKWPSTSQFSKVFCIVVGAHLLVGLVLFVSSPSTASASSSDQKIVHQDKTQPPVDHSKDVPMDQTPPPMVLKPAPTPKPHITPTKHTPTPTPTPTVKLTPKPTPKKDNKLEYIKDYVVKEGDTIRSISKKYKLNSNRLLQINGIKDPNKIFLGQKLKFM